ncbi:two-component system histidine kinase PnpS [Geoalkalibacter halelectricus]|uniref:histidine kinase n=1 Tax=Geoalkalibacter halelectricus TaxID=2847045 RepID=A0ABY5ZL18_9BACT|nr:ATP-binding protein [Geoalkalibacter halelectricus]MDO3377738.1 ATP-binding protein [Geoalkalibacter halelectricus]UWZ78667.1 ATP-binding protein [Geoalkalibacter halelectricus]
MRRPRLFWQLFPSYVALTVAVLIAAGWYFSTTLKNFYLSQLAADLTAQARLIEPQVAARFGVEHGPALDALAKDLGRRAGVRITLVLPGGEVLGDSLQDPRLMDNHAARPEIVAAFAGSPGVATRYSATARESMMYAAVPVVVDPGGMAGAVRVAIPVTAVERTLSDLRTRTLAAGLVITLLAALLSLAVSRRISRPLEEMKAGVDRFAAGDLDRRLAVDGSEEIHALGQAMNRMAAELDDRIRTVLRHRNEQEAVLSSMVEGVLAVDRDERVIRINQAALRLLGLRDQDIKGRRIQEVVRKADLQRFVSRALAAAEPVEEDIVLHEGGERYLQAHGTPLHDAREQIGALIVLNDVTRLRRLETMRRDFVSNVSHELKTPITAIKGFVETLLDGAMHDPDDARRFLEIITRQADRLNAIIDDLLTLSRVEQGEEQGGLPLEELPLRPVLEAAVQACALLADEKALRINLFCSPELKARIKAPLLEQAVVNLLTNAIKYSPREGKVAIEAARFQDKVTIRVQDWGCGIPKEHLPRLFERFYRVDKARSRKQGGTGLGLAIVKHIVQAHGGEVIVHSTPGQGSTFSIHLPGC